MALAPGMTHNPQIPSSSLVGGGGGECRCESYQKGPSHLAEKLKDSQGKMRRYLQ